MRGYQKICLFACYFQSSTLDVPAEPDGTLAGAAAFFRAAFPPEVPAAARALGWEAVNLCNRGSTLCTRGCNRM